MNEAYVLDSFAVLALLGEEPGADEVARMLRRAQAGEVRLAMTWVNLGEVAYIVERRRGMEQVHRVLAMLEATALEIVPAGRELALAAAHFKAGQPLAYADAFSAALAQQIDGTLVSGDPEFRLVEGAVRVKWLPSAG